MSIITHVSMKVTSEGQVTERKMKHFLFEKMKRKCEVVIKIFQNFTLNHVQKKLRKPGRASCLELI